MTKSKAKGAQASNGKTVLDQPVNPLATEDMAENVANLYFTAAKNRHQAQVLQIANDQRDDEPIPGSRPLMQEDGVTVVVEDGAPVYPTYGTHIAGLTAQMERLRENFDDIWPTVEQMLERRKLKVAEENAG